MPGSVQAVERAAAILRVLADSPEPLGVGQVARALGLPKPTAHGLIRTLYEVGFVGQDPGTSRYFQSGVIAAPLVEHSASVIRAQSLNYADSLAARSSEAVHVAVLEGTDAVIAHHVFGPNTSRDTVEVGTHWPAYACALGKVLLAFRPAAADAALAASLEPMTYRTVSTPTQLSRQLTATRTSGWACDAGELWVDKAGVAAPIRARGGLVIAAIGISGPIERVCDHRLAPRSRLVQEVTRVARVISANFGYRVPR
ncbi:IclR family transcriptional regulator [Mycobacterium sp. D16Q16]|uniref:IclR family transcriptional regulator n=1 Tax=Mycobacterium sp. D16Q16 TaxID=1855659 RepID=UPI0009939D73|nr:IclR family transcriptional regulator [Mycobacterium sp. D16Q16]